LFSSSSPIQQRMYDWIAPYYMLNRVPVSDDMSFFVNKLAEELKVDVLSLPSGSACLTWEIPDKWTVNEAYIETLSGERVADFHIHPMQLKAYSAAFSGIVSREELLNRISSHPTDPDRLNYINRWQYQLGVKTEWGFSVPSNVVDNLTDESYKVHIDTAFGKGTCDIIDWILPGELPDTIFLAAHTCHPGQVNDGIACIALLMEIFRYLQKLPYRRYTYRLILGPEYYASAGVLQHGKHIEHLQYGIFLDMMANSHPISYSRSFDGNSYIDHIAGNILKHNEADSSEAPYRKLYGNDEMFYDGPDYRIPTLGMSRYPFANYHTELDDLEHCDFTKLEQSLTILQQIIDVFETDCIPTRTYKGPLYLSKYNLYIDPKFNPKGYANLQEIQILMDGTRSCLEIAQQLDISYTFVFTFVTKLCQHNLATNRPIPSRTHKIVMEVHQ
jgi:aminopeptidase-like protein